MVITTVVNKLYLKSHTKFIQETALSCFSRLTLKL